MRDCGGKNPITTNYCGGRNVNTGAMLGALLGDPPGNRSTGYSSSEVTHDPVYWRCKNPTFDHASDFLQPRMNIFSVSHTDFQQPREVRTGGEPISLISSKGTNGTGFRNTKEGPFCFAPSPSIYGQHTRCYDDPKHYLTTYTDDYPYKSSYCDHTGKRLVGKPPQGTAAAAMIDSIDMDHGYTGNYRSETENSFTIPGPTTATKTLWTGIPISQVSGSSFARAAQYHRAPGCGFGQFQLDGTDPQRYNPWSRLLLGHHTLMNSNFHPHPLNYGKVDFAQYAAITTSNEPTTVLY